MFQQSRRPQLQHSSLDHLGRDLCISTGLSIPI